MSRKLLAMTIWISLFTISVNTAVAQESRRDPNVIGQAFGKPVTAREFNYYLITSSLFTRTGMAERDEEEIRAEAWQNLIYVHEARELGISVSRGDLEKELKRLMAEKDIEYGSEDYKAWPKMSLGEDVKTFERRIDDLLTVNKFMMEKGNPEVVVTGEEMEQKFRNQYNSFESEYIKFDTEEETKEYAKKFKEDPVLWKKTWDEKKPLGQKGASWINTMSLEALIDLWKIPKEDAYRILSHKKGDFIASKFFYGDAVFRLLSKREADMEKYDDKKKEYYRTNITRYRKQKIVKEYFENLLKRADYKDYVWEEKRAKKIGEIKTKSLVALETKSGIIVLKLFPDIAPYACENFIGLVEQGYYDGIIFHRVIKDFMIQGGDPTGTGTGGESIWSKPFINEISEDVTFDKPGILAMANSGPNTNTSQFFITVKETPWLNKKHTIFGEVDSGYDVVEKIIDTPVDAKNKPKEDQKIIKAYIKNRIPKQEDLKEAKDG
jgi:peptidylprolyl isomerase